jgi:hypothetical protein
MNEFDPWLELANTLSNSHERVKFQRDELLALARDVAALSKLMTEPDKECELIERARALVAKVEATQAK